MSAHEVWQAGTSVLKNDTGRFLRAYGTFPHPNILGGFLSAVLVLGVAYQAFQTKTQEVRGTRQDGCIGIAYLLSRISYHVSLLIILLGLILTFSRSAWLGAALGVIVYIVFRIKYHVWGKWDTRMLLTLGIATAIFVGVLHETVFPRFDGAVIEREGSVSERVQSLEDAKVVIGEGNVLLGTGAGNFTVQVMRLQPERSVWTIQPAHNVPVLVFAELGLVGLILFVAFLFSVILNAVKNLEIPLRQSADRNDNQGHSTMYIAALVVLVPILLLDHYLWTSHFGLFFLFLLLGLASRK
jgi:O-antigen ligase